MTSIRAIESTDIRNLLRLIDISWRIHLRISPVEFETKIKNTLGFVAEDRVGLRGFMMIEPLQPDAALIVGAGLRDTWGIRPFLDLFLPKVQRAAVDNDLPALVHVGGATWLVDELKSRGFKVREWVAAFERIDINPPAKPARAPARIRTAHYNDLPTLLTLDRLAFGHIWHKSLGNFSEALAKAASFTVALINDQMVAYEWCEIYKEHAHLTRLAVHPDYQGQGIGAQLLYQAITDALVAGANLITLNTQEHNHRSRALYERFGFVDTKQRIPVLWKDLG
jgi:ribosomal-protein-alanine N-acetyltransferase